ncbi:glyoxylate pathway regulator [Mytilinidion resinicola]|uniref:Glyoxylate pathway regulator n=1 Tax=Mytilinidion resinicola TaxID=574789 RepID=A0A6A6Z229_9PEZI|nr:glyoxylate pathway regulator [Mytilinidion resinicola]KAF2814769.1 glyoxylate pathway regulator [Mytilinidion resinicola]
MATAQEHQNAAAVGGETPYSKETNGTSAIDHGATTKQRAPYDYGGNPLAHVRTNDSQLRMPAFGGEFQPGLYRPPNRKFGNPAPLGLSAFALTTFVLSLINMGTRNIGEPNIVVAIAFGYGGLVQLLAGMWEMAVGNTFGATALSSYGGFWLSFAIILTPGGFQIESTLEAKGPAPFFNSFGLYLMGWFIFTFILLICTLKSTVAFFSLFFTLDLAFLLLGIGYLQHGAAGPNTGCIKAGGVFGILAAFLAWYNALAGIADSSNSFFVIPVAHFPWSDTGRERRSKVDNSNARDAAHVA